MPRYLLQRILRFVYTLFFISLIGFVLFNCLPGDPALRILGGEPDNSGNDALFKERHLQLRKELGLDLPLFYISVNTLAEPDSLNKIYNPAHRKALNRLVNQFGNWKAVVDFYKSELQLRATVLQHVEYSPILNKLDLLLQSTNDKQSDLLIEQIGSDVNLFSRNSPLAIEYNSMLNCRTQLITNTQRWKNYVPVLRFHSLNQYHRWIFGDGNAFTGNGAVYSRGIIRGDFGKSYITGKAVLRLLNEKIGWTLFFSLGSILLAFAISIPLGVVTASRYNSNFDKRISFLLLLLYSIPPFWFAVFLLMLFANPDNLLWFPASGVQPVSGYEDQSSWMQKLYISLPYLILPLVAYTFSSIAFITRIVRASVIEQLSMNYILTARAKGLPERTVLWSHAFRNSLFPLITLFGYIFPALISGSVILERIFSIPGLGTEVIQAVFNFDYPVLNAIFMITGFLAVAGFLFADLLYSFADPRVRLPAK